MAFIDVFIQLGEYPGPRDIRIREVLSEDIVRRTFVRLDHPSFDADVFIREFICSSTATIKEVTMDRKRAAELISGAVTEALIEAMGMADTKMGYSKNEVGNRER